jgi:hypothetical protein
VPRQQRLERLQPPAAPFFGHVRRFGRQNGQAVNGIVAAMHGVRRLGILQQPAHGFALVLLGVLVTAKLRRGLQTSPAGDLRVTNQTIHTS